MVDSRALPEYSDGKEGRSRENGAPSGKGRRARVRIVLLAVLAFFFMAVLIIGSRILLGFCVYYDARYRKNENAVLWGLLSGLFNIAALVYIIVQISSRPQGVFCSRCGAAIAPGGRFCPRCGRMLHPAAPEQTEGYNRKRKLFLGLWIGTLVVSILSFILLYAAIFVRIVSRYGIGR